MSVLQTQLAYALETHSPHLERLLSGILKPADTDEPYEPAAPDPRHIVVTDWKALRERDQAHRAQKLADKQHARVAEHLALAARSQHAATTADCRLPDDPRRPGLDAVRASIDPQVAEVAPMFVMHAQLQRIARRGT